MVRVRKRGLGKGMGLGLWDLEKVGVREWRWVRG